MTTSRWAVTTMGFCVVMMSPHGSAAGETRPLTEAVAAMSIPFIENEGQMDGQVAYSAATEAGTLFVTRDGKLVYSLGASDVRERGPMCHGANRQGGWILVESLSGARPVVAGGRTSKTNVSVFRGTDAAKWRAHVRSVEDVSLGEPWPGISVDLHAHGGNIEKVFSIEPGASAADVDVHVSGSACMSRGGAGDLILETGLGEVRLTHPAAYQMIDGVRRPVAAAYSVKGGDSYGFALGPYDESHTLVVDPIVQATYLGGSDSDSAYAVAVSPTNRDLYAVGQTRSADFPGTAGGAQPVVHGGSDVFVARMNAGLTSLVQATYYGGSEYESGYGLAIAPASGDVYVSGVTFSTDLAGTIGGAQPASGGGSYDGFAARFNSTLTTLYQATYIGGPGEDDAVVVLIHPFTGDVYLSGETYAAGFPNTAGGAQSVFGGSVDAYVARLNPSLTSIIQATYFGGSAGDYGGAMVVDPASGDLVISGYTGSTALPGTAGGAQPASSVLPDGYVARLNSTLTSLVQSTYLGGNSDDWCNGLVFNPTNGDLYAVGSTASTDFPGTAGGAQTGNGGARDGFVARLNPALTSLVQSTYFGGSGDDFAHAIGASPATGDLYIGGDTKSANLPGTGSGPQPVYAGARDAFLARFSSTLSSAPQSTYMGGSDWDMATTVSVNPSTGDVYVAGSTGSADFPATSGSFQPARAGTEDSFIARFTSDPRGPLVTSVKSKSAKAGSKATVSGFGFSTSSKLDKVYFGTKSAKVKKAKSTSLSVNIPKGIKGLVGVRAVVNGVSSNTVMFTVK